MDTQQERLLQLDRDLKSGKNICSSGGVLSCFPSSLKEPFLMQGLGLIVCRQGSFQFSLDNKCASAKAGETLFIHEESWVQVLQETEDVEILILAYQIEPIRDIIGNSVVSMYMYSKLTPELSCVWNTGEEDEIMKYMSLIDSVLEMEESVFSLYEQKLLLLALTYRICSVYNRKLISAGQETGGRKNEIFIRLIQLISEKAFRYLKTLKKAFKKFLIFLTFRMLLILAHSSRSKWGCRRSNIEGIFNRNYSFSP